MNPFSRLGPYVLIASLLALSGCPYGMDRRDGHGGDHGNVEQRRGHPDDGRHDDRNRRPDSDEEHHGDTGPRQDH